jgi:hypothetical protein
MTGITCVLSARTAPLVYSVTIGTFSSVSFGYDAGNAYGAISSTALRNNTITGVGAASAQFFTLALANSVEKSFFSHLIVQTSAGTFVTLRAADATFTSSRFWDWNVGSLLWDNTSPSPRSLVIYA